VSIIRVSHQKNYVVIKNDTALQDVNLSWKAKGIWAYCMSRPDDWEFHVNHLITVSGDGRDSVYAGLKELEEQGYLTRNYCREKGKYAKIYYTISEIKIIPPHRESPNAENPPLLSIERKLSIEINQPTQTLPKKSKEKPILKKEEVGRSVFSKEKEELKKKILNFEFVEKGDPDKLTDRFTEKEVNDLFEKHSCDQILKAIKYTASMKKKGKIKQTEKGYLLTAIRKGYCIE